jgi:hypothetical protein
MRTIRSAIVALSLGVAVLFVNPAEGHPYGPEYSSFRTVVQLDGDTLTVTTAVEAPTMKVLEEFSRRYEHLEEIGPQQDREFFRAMIDEVTAGLEVRVAGKQLEGTWVAADSPINGRADDRFFYYFVTMTVKGALPVGQACEIEVLNTVFAGQQAYYSGWIQPLTGWAVTTTNLQALGDAAQAEDVSQIKEAWSNDEALRDLRASLAPTTGEGS